MHKHTLFLATLSLTASLLFQPVLAANPVTLHNHLAQSAPELNPRVLGYALDAMRCAMQQDKIAADRLAVIDFSLPSSEKRLWIFDLKKRSLLLNDFVAHGAKSGDNLPNRFSNIMVATSPASACFAAPKAIAANTATRCAWTG